MITKVSCPQCAAVLKVPEQLQGKQVRCPRCQTVVQTPAPSAEQVTAAPTTPPAPPALPEGTFRIAGEPAPSPAPEPEALPEATLVMPAEEEPPRKKWKRKKKPKGLLARLGLGNVVIEAGLIKLVVGVVAAVVVGVGAYYLVRLGLKMPPPPDIPDNRWQFVEAGGCKVLFPGTPNRQNQSMQGLNFVMLMYQPDKDTVFGLGYTEGPLPPDRRNLPAETLLSDACNGSAANIIQMGGREVRRDSIQLGSYPGKQLLMYIPRASGHMVSRCYLAAGRLFIVTYGGTGVEEGQRNLTKFFDSFQILDPEAKPADASGPPAGGVPPGQGPQPVAGVADSLKKLGLAMHRYHDAFGQFPPQCSCDKDGKPLLSWRVALLRVLGEGKLYQEFHLDEPWDSPHNLTLLPRMPRVFAGDPGAAKDTTATPFQVFHGKGALFEGLKAPRITQITDGTSNTIMLVEAAEPVPWTKPEDLAYDPDKPLPKLGAPNRDTFFACFADGAVRALAKNASEASIRAMITAAAGD
jgi:hypothetical protein